MCGILAIFGHLDQKELQEILGQVHHLNRRGPDSKTVIHQSRHLYVFCRLAINDLSPAGNQPMVYKNYTMMCNGEIYNCRELDKKYKLDCQSGSDCEVIAKLHDRFGFVEMVKKLHGVFAIILDDGQNVYFSRDRIGVRPLFLGYKGSHFCLASIPNVLVPFCQNVRPFPPGTTAVWSKMSGDMTILANDTIMLAPKTIDNGEEMLRTSLIQAVRYRLLSDRPIGCLLSGGLDSSIITALLVRELGGKNVRTYSIGMKGSTDLYYARKVADCFKTDHHEVLFTPEEGFAVIPEVVEQLGSYDITTVRASVGMFLISRYIAKNTTDRVIFSGEGSDELFGGYLYFHSAPTATEGREEGLRLIRNLHLYDVLRADRCISCNGLELREPFLDRNVVDVALSLPAEQKIPQNGYEKFILRQAFRGFLPDDVLWRRKEGFSDGVSGLQKPWYQYISEMVDSKIPDEIFNPLYPSKEAMYYKLLFDKRLHNWDFRYEYWMPRWTNSKDPSGRLIKAYDERNDDRTK